MSLLDMVKKSGKDLAAKTNRDRPEAFPNGSSTWRILPSSLGAGNPFYLKFVQHWIRHPFIDDPEKPSEKKLLAVWTSQSHAYGVEDEITESIEAGIVGADDPAIQAALGGARGSERHIMAMLCLEGPAKGEVKVMNVPQDVFEVIYKRATKDKKFMNGEIVEPSFVSSDSGEWIFEVERSGSGRTGTRYSCTADLVEPSQLDANIVGQIPDLNKYIAGDERAKSRALMAVKQVINPSGPQLVASTVATPAIAAPAAVVGAATAGTFERQEQPLSSDLDSMLTDLEAGG